MNLHEYQADILDLSIEHSRLATYGPRGLGKTTTIASKILHFVQTNEAAGVDWKVITLASSHTQLSHYLWPEIHKWANRIELPGRIPAFTNQELNLKSINMKYGQAFCVGTDEPDKIEGAHADRMLVVIDEAKGVPVVIWDALEGMDARGENVSYFALSTPGMPVGRYHSICINKPGYEDWHVKRITLEEAIASGMVSEAWVERRRRQWGEDSPMFRQHVLGQFAGVEDDAVFRSVWIEKAVKREAERSEIIQIGVDIAERGGDETALAPYTGDKILPLKIIHSEDLMQTTGHIVLYLKEHHESVTASIDSIGIGAGVQARLDELGMDNMRFIGSGSPHDSETFVNARAEAYWLVREMLQREELTLPDDDLLKEELLATQLKPQSDGRIQLIEKKKIKQLIGRSPDRADAVSMAVYQHKPWISVRDVLTNRQSR